MSDSPSALSLAIPRQHGAWSALVASFLLGALGAGRPTAATALLVLCLLAAFVAHNALVRFVRLARSDVRRRGLGIRGAALGGVTLVLGGLLVLAFGIRSLVPVGALALVAGVFSLWAERRRKGRTLAAEVLGMLALSLAVPAAAATTSGGLSVAASGPWALSALFFVGSIARVRYLVRARGLLRSGSLGRRLRAALPSLGFHTAGLLLLFAIAAASIARANVALAFLPVVGYVIWCVGARAAAGLSIRAIGFTELGLTVALLGLSLANVG